MDISIVHPPRRGRGWFWGGVVILARAFAAVSAVALGAMALLVCADVAMRLAGFAFTGAHDIVGILAVVAVAGALPLTTAMKGHVAIEFFFGKLGRGVRLGVDSIMRVTMIAALCFVVRGFWLQGVKIRAANDVSSTLQIPLFWTYWVLAAACALTALVVVFHLVKPGKEMVRA